jgi:hypothetical protein
VKNPTREGTLILGDAGSSSDALSNPKVFVWYKGKNLLLLPAIDELNKGLDDNISQNRHFNDLLGYLAQAQSKKIQIHIVPSSAENLWKKIVSSIKDTS